jgi:hypothetical protein
MMSFCDFFISWVKVDFASISATSVGVMHQYAKGCVIFLKHSREPASLSAAQHVKK